MSIVSYSEAYDELLSLEQQTWTYRVVDSSRNPTTTSASERGTAIRCETDLRLSGEDYRFYESRAPNGEMGRDPR